MIIDSDEYEAAGIETMTFPGGEPHAKIPTFNFDKPVVFVLRARSWRDIGFGACVWDALRRQWANLNRLTWVGFPTLFMPYSFAARQDKTDGHAPITKGLISNLFKGGLYKAIHVFDIHSDLHNHGWHAKNWMPSDLDFPIRNNFAGFIAPDAGAAARTLDFQRKYGPMTPIFQCSKRRDATTGQLSDYFVPQLGPSGTYLVVDDICDGGGTFNLLAAAVKKARPDIKLELFVSHGIFSKGFDTLFKNYEHIYTTDSIYPGNMDDDRRPLTVFPLTRIVEKIHNER